ncbi:MAG TPA: methyltransferase domain-containing protein [Bryobacteraceae bacterium]|nr:methyltransferase domain-containing protein [Bryobacteraceae bacterium]
MDASRVRELVREAYSAAAEAPEAGHAFPVGRAFAESLGYCGEWLQEIPDESVEAFSGVAGVSLNAAIPPGAAVLDLGCGAGLDSFISARRAGPGGRILGIDFSAAMLKRAVSAAKTARAASLLFCQADGERLPVKTGSIDVALVNGIFNLNPARGAIFAELARVVRRGGAVYAAELILRQPPPPAATANLTDWFA